MNLAGRAYGRGPNAITLFASLDSGTVSPASTMARTNMPAALPICTALRRRMRCAWPGAIARTATSLMSVVGVAPSLERTNLRTDAAARFTPMFLTVKRPLSRHGGPPEGPRQTRLSAIQEPVRSAPLSPKIAVHCLSPSSLTAPSAEQPFQPPKIEPGAGVAVSATVVLRSWTAEQVAPQSMPGGSLVTVTEPAPDLA